jgi:bifunctional enzyme ispD/ispF
MENSKIAIVITAAGSSTRIGGNTKKEYLPLDDGTVLSNCVSIFLNTTLNDFSITDFIITCPAGKIEQSRNAVECDKHTKKLLNTLSKKNHITIDYVEGGKTRQSSVFNALTKIKNSPEIVLIHDGARPFVTQNVILRCIKATFENGASVPGITPTDTQKQIDENGFIAAHLQRNMLVAVQTPQCFEFKKLFEAHKKATLEKKEYTDDTEIWGVYCGKVKVVEGDYGNIKITYQSDIEKLGAKND